MHMTMDPAARASARDAVQSLRERMAALQAGTIAAPTPEPGQAGASSCIFPKIFRGCDSCLTAAARSLNSVECLSRTHHDR